ncbi:MAG TPA: PAS domain S-box protein [Vicinamibacterales bacterium]|nr:PAS domain S-box protein [Vicinamibacterales bacterium]
MSSQDQLRHIVEFAQDLIYYCDGEGRFTYVNRAAARVMGFSEDELIGRHYLSLIHPAHQQRAAEFYQRQMRDRTPNTYFEFLAVSKEHREIWIGQHVQIVYDGGTPVGVHAIARDITHQKAIEERLRKSEAHYRSLIQGAAYGMYRTTADGEILDANPALARMLGYASVDELRTRRMSDVWESVPNRVKVIAENAHLEYATADVRWRRKDGSSILVHLSARRVQNEDGSYGFEGIAEDITERRALEEQLRRAQRMEAIGRLARGVAHDFNNVLAAIIGSGDLLQMQLREDDPAREEAREIQKAAERGASLTRRLLTFARNQMIEPEVVDLDAAVLPLARTLQRVAGDRVPVRVRTRGRPTLIKIEPGQLEQVLLNLVVNAREAMMPDGGPVDITVDALTLDARLASAYSGLPAGRYARITVRDTGVGIEPEMQPHVFEPFFTTKDPSKGTGLGLSIVYSVTKEAGGSVTFTSAPREGTTFDVLLPLLER